jgi:hypothetical protein
LIYLLGPDQVFDPPYPLPLRVNKKNLGEN